MNRERVLGADDAVERNRKSNPPPSASPQRSQRTRCTSSRSAWIKRTWHQDDGSQTGSVESAAGVRLERVKGIEPSSQAWEARILPLNHTRSAAFQVFLAQGVAGSKAHFGFEKKS